MVSTVAAAYIDKAYGKDAKDGLRADVYMSVRQRRKSAVTSKRSHSFTICS